MTADKCRELRDKIIGNAKSDLFRFFQRYRNTDEKYSGPQLTACMYAALVLPRTMSCEGKRADEILSTLEVTDEVRSALRHLIGTRSELMMAERMRDELKTDDLYAGVLFGANLELCRDSQRKAGLDTFSEISPLLVQLTNLADQKDALVLGAGSGDFLTEAFMASPEAECLGVEPDADAESIAVLRTSLLDSKSGTVLGDPLTYDPEKGYERVIAFPPFGLFVEAGEVQGGRIWKEFTETAGNARRISCSWVEALRSLEDTSDTGSAAVVLSPGVLSGGRDSALRKFLTDKGFIRAVILLPAKLLRMSAMALSVVVLSRGNEAVRLIDASDLGEVAGRRKVVLRESDKDEICRRLCEDGPKSKSFSLAELEEMEYRLDPVSALLKPDISDAVELKTVASRIVRGAQLSSERQQTLGSESPTQIRYLQVREMQNGYIAEPGAESVYLKEVPNRLKEQVVRDGSLIITRSGMQEPKTAVAQIMANEEILANGNTFVIELDSAKMDPYYLQAFFSSPLGKATLAAAGTGGVAAIKSLTRKDVEELKVPMPPMDEQKKIAEAYKKNSERCRCLEEQLREAERSLETAWGEGK